MEGSEHAFTGQVPDVYDTLMGPVFFEPYAAELASRIAALAPPRVLELAAGTGILTRAIVAECPSTPVLATDLNQPMLDKAASVFPHPSVTWQQADAMALPVEDASFELVACQFGAMYFLPDRVAAFREARRVLVDSGRLLFSCWDSVSANPPVEATTDAVRELVTDGRPAFLERVPYGYFDVATIVADVEAAGLRNVQIETVALTGKPTSASDIARALCAGTPQRFEIESGDASRLESVIALASQHITERLGDDEIAAPLQAHVVTAQR